MGDLSRRACGTLQFNKRALEKIRALASLVITYTAAVTEFVVYGPILTNEVSNESL